MELGPGWIGGTPEGSCDNPRDSQKGSQKVLEGEPFSEGFLELDSVKRHLSLQTEIYPVQNWSLEMLREKLKGNNQMARWFHNFRTVFALFHTFSEFFPQDFPLQNKGL